MLLITLLAFFLSPVFADVLEAPVNPIDFQQNPPSLQWKKIETEHFELIFPEEITAEAQRVAHLLEKAYPYVTRSLETRPPRIPLVLQNQSAQSNGFVTLAPRRSEWFVTPSVDPELTNTEWLKTLAIHEFRHVVQFHKTRRGFNRFYEIFLGEVGQALGLGLTLPPWFLEGDAVGMETALTKGGRGRLPLFERDLRTLLLSGKEFSYDKSHMGSYRDFIPNHYVYGYFLTSHLRNFHGDLALSTIANSSAESTWNPLTFYNATQAVTGWTFEEFYASAMANLLQEWKAKYDLLRPTPYEVKSPAKPHGWTNFNYPQYATDGRLFALKNGLSYINRFVLVPADGGEEEVVLYPGPFSQEYPYKLRSDRVAFLERELDPRWGYRDFARLKVWDLREKAFTLDLRRTKLRLAVLDPQGEKILAVSWDEKQGQGVVVLDKEGKELVRVPHPKDEVITSLDWLSSQEAVLVVKDHADQKGLRALPLDGGATRELLPKSIVNWGFVAVEEGQVLLEGPLSGIDNVYLVKDGQTVQLTRAEFGAYAPVLRGGELTYADYSAEGLRAVRKGLPWKVEQKSEGSFVAFYEKFAERENSTGMDLDLAKTLSPEVKDYSQLRNAVNLHSWLILAPPLSNSITLLGYSRDILNKFTLTAGGQYNLSERTAQGFVGAAWSHLYPVLDVRAAWGSRRQTLFTTTGERESRWEEGSTEAGIQVPWRLIQGRFSHAFTARAFTKLLKVNGKISSDASELRDGALHSPGVTLDYGVNSRMAVRDILPPWGFQVHAHGEEGEEIGGERQRGSLRSLDGRLLLPGLWKHHSFYHQLAYEKQLDDSYQYSSQVLYPRGTRHFFLDEFSKYSANYTFPLFYPDWSLSRYVYVKRLMANLYYDELDGRYRSFGYRAASTGWEILFETNVFRIFLPFVWGVRGNYVLSGQESNSYELFLSSVAGVF